MPELLPLYYVKIWKTFYSISTVQIVTFSVKKLVCKCNNYYGTDISTCFHKTVSLYFSFPKLCLLWGTVIYGTCSWEVFAI